MSIIIIVSLAGFICVSVLLFVASKKIYKSKETKKDIEEGEEKEAKTSIEIYKIRLEKKKARKDKTKIFKLLNIVEDLDKDDNRSEN